MIFTILDKNIVIIKYKKSLLISDKNDKFTIIKSELKVST
jgi:hypothetical protein